MLIFDTATRVIFDWHFCKLLTTVIVEGISSEELSEEPYSVVAYDVSSSIFKFDMEAFIPR